MEWMRRLIYRRRRRCVREAVVVVAVVEASVEWWWWWNRCGVVYWLWLHGWADWGWRKAQPLTVACQPSLMRLTSLSASHSPNFLHTSTPARPRLPEQAIPREHGV